MEEIIRGRVYVLGDNVDTDQIIPAGYLKYDPSIPEERAMYGACALSGVPDGQRGLPDGHIPFIDETNPGAQPNDAAADAGYRIIIAGKNFGCGSSREQAPMALQIAGVKAVVARTYARIFFRNSVNGGFLIPYETAQPLTELFATGDEAELIVAANALTNHRPGETHPLESLGDALPILEAGDIFQYARASGLIP